MKKKYSFVLHDELIRNKNSVALSFAYIQSCKIKKFKRRKKNIFLQHFYRYGDIPKVLGLFS